MDYRTRPDGQVRTSFDPGFPGTREGTDPGHLDGHLRELGIDPTADDQIDNHLPAALALASRISGVTLTPTHLEEPLLGGRITSPGNAGAEAHIHAANPAEDR